MRALEIDARAYVLEEGCGGRRRFGGAKADWIGCVDRTKLGVVSAGIVTTTQDVLDLLRAARPQLAREFGITRLALFGSYARGEQREDSDVDVLVEVDPSIGMRFVDLAERIEVLLGVRSDVVSRRAIALRHWARIAKDLVDVR